MANINEERLLSILYWQSPLLSGFLVILLTLENFTLYSEHPFMFHYRVVQLNFTKEIEVFCVLLLLFDRALSPFLSNACGVLQFPE